MGTEHSCVWTRRQEGVRCLSDAHSICACLTVWVCRIPRSAACSSYLFQPALPVLGTCLSDSLKVLGWPANRFWTFTACLGPCCHSMLILASVSCCGMSSQLQGSIWRLYVNPAVWLRCFGISLLHGIQSSDAPRVETQLWFSTYAQWWHLAA